MTTLDAIRRDSNPATFPTHVLAGAESAACFFCAGFLGRNDVIHVADAKVRRVVLVDNDPGKLEEMFRLYPQTWATFHGDAFAAAEEMRARGDGFDVSIVDPWSNAIPHALLAIPTWLAVTRKHLVIAASRDWFDGLHIQPTIEDAQSWLKRTHWNGYELDAEVAAITWRSNYLRGIYWITLRKNATRSA